MQFLRVEVSNYHFGGHQWRVTARNDAGQVIIGLSKVFHDDSGPDLLQEVVEKMEKTQDHVTHNTPLGKE